MPQSGVRWPYTLGLAVAPRRARREQSGDALGRLVQIEAEDRLCEVLAAAGLLQNVMQIESSASLVPAEYRPGALFFDGLREELDLVAWLRVDYTVEELGANWFALPAYLPLVVLGGPKWIPYRNLAVETRVNVVLVNCATGEAPLAEEFVSESFLVRARDADVDPRWILEKAVNNAVVALAGKIRGTVVLDVSMREPRPSPNAAAQLSPKQRRVRKAPTIGLGVEDETGRPGSVGALSDLLVAALAETGRVEVQKMPRGARAQPVGPRLQYWVRVSAGPPGALRGVLRWRLEDGATGRPIDDGTVPAPTSSAEFKFAAEELARRLVEVVRSRP